MDVSAQTDPHDLKRFLDAQERGGDYARALAEVRQGRKLTHWMWYVFPQIDGLGSSPTARHYAIKSVTEAQAYLAHPVLGPRLTEAAEAAAGVRQGSATSVFGSPDDLKLKSSATLFAAVAPDGSPAKVACERVLARYFDGARDDKTLRLLGR